MSTYHKGEKISDYYKIEEELGRGSFAIVRSAINKKTGEKVAIKIIDRQSLEEEDEIALQTEVDILSQIDHPNVVKLYEIFDDKDCMYLVLELMTGGELFDRIVEKEHYSEMEAAETIKPIVDAIRYCHNMGIIHRDLKPENLLYGSRDQASIIKIADFGLARFLQGELATTACGTPGYVAPEILEGRGYGKEVDYWSIGVILYILQVLNNPIQIYQFITCRLCGFPPFYDENNQKLFDTIKNVQFDFPSPYWDDVSEVAKDLIKSLLVKEPSLRLNAEQLLSHPWIIGDGTPRKQLPNVTQQIKEFNTRRRFKVSDHFIQPTIFQIKIQTNGFKSQFQLQRATYLVMAANRFSNILKLK
ncbi:protein kinase domain containing protein [Stylonychia lemnae]|uniref:non-specific serine/threonine protein kinase n=1 Tax=Stylonychia lemnae TaxID=5949 RepID=A0A078B1Q7_STYLE|nr:protein kinase domain containing protein [Stylonychia lemnae]|eukprot:CDW88495.1 protein kinase domain containing protein [Stylonychia lemnae]